jgi:hypothetical protein
VVEHPIVPRVSLYRGLSGPEATALVAAEHGLIEQLHYVSSMLGLATVATKPKP